MAQLAFEQIINLTEDSGNTMPTLTQKLMIGNEPNNELYQYYIYEALTKDKKAYIVLAAYNPLQWGPPDRHLTGLAVSNIGIKTFPQLGAYGFYTRLGESSSKLLMPIHLRRNVFYAAPTLTFVEQTDSYIFTFTNPADITYYCFRLILTRGQFADEYVSYLPTLEVPKSELNGSYVGYAIGYVGEGQYVSEDSNLIELSLVNPNPPGPVEYYSTDEVDSIVDGIETEIAAINDEIGDIGTALDAINGEVI